MLRYTKVSVLLFFLSELTTGQNLKQNLISTSGNYFSSGSYNLSWSIGEPVTATFSTGTNKISQGFHQPPLKVTSLEENSATSNLFQVYPNPTTSFIVINSSEFQEPVEYFITDILGKELIAGSQLGGNKIEIDLQPFACGQYLLCLKQSANSKFYRFKIQKIN